MSNDSLTSAQAKQEVVKAPRMFMDLGEERTEGVEALVREVGAA